MSYRSTMESALTTLGEHVSLLETVISLIAASLVFASALMGFFAVRSWVDEKRRNASRVMIAVLDVQSAIKRIRNSFRSAAEYQLAKSYLAGITNNNNPAVIGQIAINRLGNEMKCISELESCINISLIVFGCKLRQEIDKVIFIIKRIEDDAKILIQTGHGSINATRLLSTVTDSGSGDVINEAIEQHIKVIEKNIGLYLPPNT